MKSFLSGVLGWSIGDMVVMSELEDEEQEESRMHAKSLQSCQTLCNPMDCSLPVSVSMGFSRQEYWSGLPCPPPETLSNPGIKLGIS